MNFMCKKKIEFFMVKKVKNVLYVVFWKIEKKVSYFIRFIVFNG